MARPRREALSPDILPILMSGAAVAARIVATGLLIALLSSTAAAQSDARNNMSVPPSTIFKSMLRFAETGEWSKLNRSLTLLKPVLAEHEDAFGAAGNQGIVDRIHSEDPKAALQAVRALVVRDSVVLMR